MRAALHAIVFSLASATSLAQVQPSSPSPNPFAGSQAKAQYAPDRDYDLLHVSLDLNVDHVRRTFHGVVVNTLAPLRDNLTTIRFHCGENVEVEMCEVAGKEALFTRGSPLKPFDSIKALQITAPSPLPRGQAVPVTIRFASSRECYEFQWITPTSGNPQRVGFWTAGVIGWLPTWEYPNDFATSETRVTVPADWQVIGNGTLESNALTSSAKQRTFHWRMTQPHATYLTSLVAGPLDLKRSSWRDVELIYAVPKGKEHLIDDTFGDTPDMLSFFSDTLGVKYPWPKYAQVTVSGYPGGRENVSATTLNEDNLVDRRGNLQSVTTGQIAHELAHQWFGDLVTFRDYGHFWLNEGFAGFFSNLYMEHACGKDEYDRRMEGSVQNYLSESRRYKRPLATNLYPSYLRMFDRHTYSKGTAVLHTLRRTLGDKVFFAGLHHYLTKHKHTPVDSHDLCCALTEATGINVEPFFDQWVYKPGHPVLDYTWIWDEAKQQVVLTVRQVQDTKDGTPVYDLTATVGLIHGGHLIREKAKIDQAEQEVRIDAVSRPDAVLLDPDHDFLREIPTLPWKAEELVPILQHAPNAVDREEAMRRMLQGTPSDEVVQAVRADKGRFPAFRSIAGLARLKRDDLRQLFREQLAHANFDRRSQAVRALGQLPKDPADIQALRGLVSDQQPYDVVRAAVSTLGNWDAPGNRDVFQKAVAMGSLQDYIRPLAYDALAKADAAEGKERPDPDPQLTQLFRDVMSDTAKGISDSPNMAPEWREMVPRLRRFYEEQLKGLTSFAFLAREEAGESGIDRRGSRISHRLYYRMVSGPRTLYGTFSVNGDRKVTDITFYFD